ncbi:MAG: AhpC/TSA family protein [Crocinitomicaceae bacterium]|nr:AhpC/TSA family protein [Crocinitomicaceae bacterium]
MKKHIKYLLFLPLVMVMIACGGSEEEEVGNPNGIKISGSLEGENANGTKVSLWVFETDEDRIVDSAVVKDSKFTLWTDTKELREYAIQFEGSGDLIYLFPDETAGNIEVSGKYPGLSNDYEVIGDQNSIDYRNYWMFIRPIYDLREAYFMSYQGANQADTSMVNGLKKSIDSLFNEGRNYAIKYIDEKPGSPISWIMLQEFYPILGLEYFDSLDLDYFRKVSKEMQAKYPYSDYYNYVDQSIEGTLAQLEALKGNGGGDLAPELEYPNPDGKMVSLSSLRGQVVLIDFWASWCGPCRMENPNVVKTYNAYKDKGFTIYSVSLDTEKDKWIQAIEADNLMWPNHVSDLKGWQSEAAAKYGVNSIPATFLIDKEGKIIDQNLRGVRLEQKLQEILG